MSKSINPMDAALAAIPTTKAVEENAKGKSSVKITPGKVESGWGCVTQGPKGTYHTKQNADTWNQNDIQWYVKNLYSEKYGVSLHIPLMAGHDWLNKIKWAMYKKLGDVDPTGSMLKDYLDFCFAKHVDQIIRDDGRFSLFKLTKPQYVLDYFDKRRPAPPVPVTKSQPAVEVSEAAKGLSMDDLTTAFRINSQYMVSNYGIVIPVNYLMAVKGKTLDEAVAYVQGAMTKLAAKGPQEMQAAIAATNKYQPYPKWLKFTDVAKIVKMTIAISDDNQVFNALKEQK